MVGLSRDAWYSAAVESPTLKAAAEVALTRDAVPQRDAGRVPSEEPGRLTAVQGRVMAEVGRELFNLPSLEWLGPVARR